MLITNRYMLIMGMLRTGVVICISDAEQDARRCTPGRKKRWTLDRTLNIVLNRMFIRQNVEQDGRCCTR